MSNPSTVAVSASALPSAGIVGTSAVTRAALRKRGHTSRTLASDAVLESTPVNYRRREQQIREDDAFTADSEDSFHGKDMNHSIRGEAVVDTSHASKKPIANVVTRDPIRANLSLNLRRKPADGSGNTTGKSTVFQSVNRAMTRFVLLFILLAGLGTTYWNWSKPESSSSQIPKTAVKLTELEHLFKKTIKMMQVQLDLVDMKVLKEVDGLRHEMEEKIGEQNIALETQLLNMKAKVDDVEESLNRLVNRGLPTMHELEDFANSIIEKRIGSTKGEVMSLNEVREVARRIVQTEIEKHSADGIARVDYALASGGGRVVDHSEGYFIGRGTNWGTFALSFLPGGITRQALASKVLEPTFGEPGQCLPLKGSNVYVDIALRTAIFPEAVTLEHVSKSVAYDISSAPRKFRVFGWLDSYKQADVVSQSMIRYLLGEFTYSMEKPNVQTFPVSEDSAHKLINMVKLEVLSNYGSSSHTCIYRFRVHGSDPLTARPIL